MISDTPTETVEAAPEAAAEEASEAEAVEASEVADEAPEVAPEVAKEDSDEEDNGIDIEVVMDFVNSWNAADAAERQAGEQLAKLAIATAAQTDLANQYSALKEQLVEDFKARFAVS